MHLTVRLDRPEEIQAALARKTEIQRLTVHLHPEISLESLDWMRELEGLDGLELMCGVSIRENTGFVPDFWSKIPPVRALWVEVFCADQGSYTVFFKNGDNILTCKALEFLKIGFNSSNNPIFYQDLGVLKLPSALFRLPKLETLEFRGYAQRKIVGFEQIGAATGLRSVRFTDCLSGGLPESLAGCIHLRALSRFESEEQGVGCQLPAWVFRLPLEELRYSVRQIGFLSDELESLTGLRRLVLPKNGLSSLPDVFGEFPNLEELDISNNRIKKLPPSFWRLTQLKSLNIADNPFSRALTELFRYDIEPLPAGSSAAMYKHLRGFPKTFAPYQQPFFQKIQPHYSLEDKLLAYKIITSPRQPDVLHQRLDLALRWLRELPEVAPLQEAAQSAIAAHSRTAPLTETSRVLVVGKPKLPLKDWDAKLKPLGARLIRKPDAKLTHVLLAAGAEIPAECVHLPVVLESALGEFVDRLDAPFLRQSDAGLDPAQIVELLWHEATENQELAVQMLAGGGVPDGLYTEVFAAFKTLSWGTATKRTLKKLLEQYAPPALRVKNWAQAPLNSITDLRYFLDSGLDEATLVWRMSREITHGLLSWLAAVPTKSRNGVLQRIFDRYPQAQVKLQFPSEKQLTELARLPCIRKLLVADSNINNSVGEKLELLPNLEEVRFECYGIKALDGTHFPALRRCHVHFWGESSGAAFPKDLLKAPNLQEFTISNPSVNWASAVIQKSLGQKAENWDWRGFPQMIRRRESPNA